MTMWPLAGASDDDPAGEVFFERKIRPVLAGTCFPCHGGKKVSGELRVDARESLLSGGDLGPAVVPGDPEGSLLIQAIRHDDELLKMPPGRDRLSDEIVADFAAWIQAGAPWPESSSAGTFESSRHWAFEPVRPVEPPPDPTGWSDHPIDRFVSAGWRERGLHPVRLADKRTLLRRVTFDLTGLPPTPEEMAAFLDDDSPDAFARVVERLLASPRYGERWGRHWMDVVRYADTAGDNADYPIPEARLYRDSIIDAFNADKPYDVFIREQLAGDILARRGPPERHAERVAATGFLALSRRYATAPYELWHLTLEDTIETTGAAFLGLTLRCARCHDHKFDPIPTEDYYALYGLFASTTFPYAGSEEFQSMNRPREHFVPLVPPDEAGPRLDDYRARIADLEGRIPPLEKERAGKDGEDAKRIDDELNRLRAELQALRRPGLPPDLPGAYAVSEGHPTDVPIQRGGDPNDPGPVVPRGAPSFLDACPPPPVPDGDSGRLQLAEWLTRPDHPLTARVMVNRVWQHHFGRGIVATPSNFGLRGAPPTHPELLDYLATRFVASGWSIKSLHRLILSSKVYQLSSDLDPDAAALDPDNAALWRHDRRRLDAEALRDAMLAVSGDLDPNRPGPHPFPSIDDWHWTQHDAFKAVYPSNHRSVYLMTQRLVRHPFLSLFDGPDPNHSTAERTSATVPLQALYLSNNPFVRDRAASLADRLRAASPDPRARIAQGIELAWSRPAKPDELDRALAYLARFASESTRAGASPDDAEREAWVSLARLLLTANEFLYLD